MKKIEKGFSITATHCTFDFLNFVEIEYEDILVDFETVCYQPGENEKQYPIITIQMQPSQYKELTNVLTKLNIEHRHRVYGLEGYIKCTISKYPFEFLTEATTGIDF